MAAAPSRPLCGTVGRSAILLLAALSFFVRSEANTCPADCTARPSPSDFVLTGTPSVTVAGVPNAARCKEECAARHPTYSFFQFVRQPGIRSGSVCTCFEHCTPNLLVLEPAASVEHGTFCAGAGQAAHAATRRRFVVNGELDKAFCLVSDRALHFNARFKGYETDDSLAEGSTAVRSWMGELGLVWKDARGRRHTLQLLARSGPSAASGNEGFLEAAVLDGARVAIPQVAGDVVRVAALTLTFLGTFQNLYAEEDRFQLTIHDRVDLEFQLAPAEPNFRLPNDALVHFTFSLQHLETTRKVHGVLGQALRKAPSSEEHLDTKYSDLRSLLHQPGQLALAASELHHIDGAITNYISSGVLAANCRKSAFK